MEEHGEREEDFETQLQRIGTESRSTVIIIITKPCKENRGQGRLDAHRVLPDLVTLSFEGALEAALQLQKGVRKHGPSPRGPLEREASRLLTQMRMK